MAKKQYIPHFESYACGGWVCICGNVETSKGFYTCDANGNKLESVDKRWRGLHACGKCGRIIKQPSPYVVGQRKRKRRKLTQK